MAGRPGRTLRPQGVADWSKISMIEASRFDPAVAYAAVDRHRLDDQKPYIYRTRDYGKTWQAITTGIAQTSSMRFARTRRNKACSSPERSWASTFRSTMATTGSRCN